MDCNLICLCICSMRYLRSLIGRWLHNMLFLYGICRDTCTFNSTQTQICFYLLNMFFQNTVMIYMMLGIFWLNVFFYREDLTVIYICDYYYFVYRLMDHLIYVYTIQGKEDVNSVVFCLSDFSAKHIVTVH